MAYKRGEPRVCSMARAPTPQEEDRRGKETAPPDLQPDSFGCVPLRFVFGGLLHSLTQIRPRIPLLNQAIKAAAPFLRNHRDACSRP